MNGIPVDVTDDGLMTPRRRNHFGCMGGNTSGQTRRYARRQLQAPGDSRMSYYER
jgi:hypothetical protein